MEFQEMVISQSASWFSDSIDSVGLTRDDYESIFRIHLWERFGNRAMRRGLVLKVLRDKVVDCRRKQKAMKATNDFVGDAEEIAVDWENKAISLDMLLVLKAMLAADDWALLANFVENGFSYREAWQSYSARSQSYSVFRRRMDTLLHHCRKIVEAIENYQRVKRDAH